MRVSILVGFMLLIFASALSIISMVSNQISYSNDINIVDYNTIEEVDGVRGCGTRVVLYDYSLIGSEAYMNNGITFMSLRPLGRLHYEDAVSLNLKL